MNRCPHFSGEVRKYTKDEKLDIWCSLSGRSINVWRKTGNEETSNNISYSIESSNPEDLRKALEKYPENIRNEVYTSTCVDGNVGNCPLMGEKERKMAGKLFDLVGDSEDNVSWGKKREIVKALVEGGAENPETYRSIVKALLR